MEILFKVLSVLSVLAGVVSLLFATIVQFANNAKGLENHIDWKVWIISGTISVTSFYSAYCWWN